MLPAVKDLDVPVVLLNIQKVRALDYDKIDIASWLGEGYACGAVGEMVADLERFGKRHAVITGVAEGGDPTVSAIAEHLPGRQRDGDRKAPGHRGKNAHDAVQL